MENIETSRTKIHEQALVCIFQYLFYDEFVSNEYKKRIEEIISDTTKTKYDDCDPFFKAIIFETICGKYAFGGVFKPSKNLPLIHFVTAV